MQPSYPYRQPAPKKSNAWKWILGSLIGLLLLCGGGLVGCTTLFSAAANDVSNQIEKEQTDKASGVKIDKCVVDRADDSIFPTVGADLTINNTTADQQTYFIDIFIKDAKGVRLANGSAMVTDVRPGQAVKHTETIYLTKKLAAGAKVNCTVDKVS